MDLSVLYRRGGISGVNDGGDCVWHQSCIRAEQRKCSATAIVVALKYSALLMKMKTDEAEEILSEACSAVVVGRTADHVRSAADRNRHLLTRTWSSH